MTAKTNTAPTNGRRHLIVAGLAVVGVAAAVLSFSTINSLAQAAGFTAAWTAALGEVHLTVRISWLLPVAVDAFGLLATMAWLTPTFGDAIRVYARRIAIADIALSAVLNALYHGMKAAKWDVAQCWPVVIGVGAIPPVFVALALHLGSMVMDDRSALTAGSVTDAPSPVAVTEPARHLFAIPGHIDRAFTELDREQTRTAKREQKTVRRPDRAAKPAPGQKPNRSRPAKTEQKPAVSVRADGELIEQVRAWCGGQTPEQNPGQLTRYRVEQITGASGRQADRVLAALTEPASEAVEV